VDLRIEVDVPHDVVAVAEVVEDLGHYSSWMTLVHSVVADGDEAWSVELRGRVGPLTRSKRLRMVRTVHETGRVRFERHEVGLRRHSDWTLETRWSGSEGGTRVSTDLHYGGRLWSSMIERVLNDEVEKSKRRLDEYLAPRRG